MNEPEERWSNETKDDAAFERSLASAMRRAGPPTGFADMVMRRAEAGERPAARVLEMPGRWRMAQVWAAGAIAATLLIGAGLQTWHREQERTAATRQFDIATRIEQQAMEHTREQLSRNGISLDQ